MGKTGGCLCGAIRYELAVDPVSPMVCHCKNCQRQAGSAFSTIVGVPEDALTITGAPKTFSDMGDKSGKEVRRQFCGDCGSPLFSHVEMIPGKVWVKVGTLDDTADFVPDAHIWTQSKQCWLDLGSAAAFETVPGA